MKGIKDKKEKDKEEGENPLRKKEEKQTEGFRKILSPSPISPQITRRPIEESQAEEFPSGFFKEKFLKKYGRELLPDPNEYTLYIDINIHPWKESFGTVDEFKMEETSELPQTHNLKKKGKKSGPKKHSLFDLEEQEELSDLSKPEMKHEEYQSLNKKFSESFFDMKKRNFREDKNFQNFIKKVKFYWTGTISNYQFVYKKFQMDKNSKEVWEI